MKIQTMSIVVGDSSCNARCPFCVSKMTKNPSRTEYSYSDKYWRNFNVACKCAAMGGVSTILLTGKGEPTLHAGLLFQHLDKLKDQPFPFIELQTNGQTKFATSKNFWEELYARGLTTVALSVVHYSDKRNKEIYFPHVPNKQMTPLDDLIEMIHSVGLTVRLTCMMLNGYIDCTSEIENLIAYCKYHKVKQLTIRPITAPENSDNEISQWIHKHTLTDLQIEIFFNYIKIHGTPVLKLAHGAVVYDYKGQNICLANCLTTNADEEQMRQIILFPDGTLGYDWKYTGAVLL